MGILTKDAILNEMRNGNIEIEPFSEDQIGPASIMGPIPLALYPGTKICQLVIQETSGRAKYQGRFKNQIHP